MSEHVWKFGDWAESLGRRCRYVSTVEHHGNLVMKYFVFESGHILHATNAIPLPDCDSWDWKPEPKYRPFVNAAEFRPHRDRWIRDKSSCAVRVTSLNDNGANGSSWWSLVKNYTFEDTNTPVGVEVTELEPNPATPS